VKVVVTLSGGLDSTTCMAVAFNNKEDIYPISFTYGQRHSIEIESAKAVAKHYGLEARHKIVDVNFLCEIGNSSLTDIGLAIPEETTDGSIPNTYVPQRNLIFASLASAYAEVLGAGKIYLGVNAVDFSGYPDCRPEFIKSLEETINLSSKNFVQDGLKCTIETPLISLSKSEIVQLGNKLAAPYHLTKSCYKGTNCGKCDSCVLRLKGFKEAGLVDPIKYLE
jgi:7-cyano-7-deazaguanine synthase